MASSSGLQSICSNTECRKVMDVPRQGWRCVDRNVDLCNQCFIAFRTKQFCDIYHKNLNNWSICKFCEKKIHRHCIVSRCWYKKLKGGGIKCNGCAPPDAILISNSRETMHNTTSKAAPRACVPQKLVANDQMTNEEYVSETSCERSTSPPLALEYYGSKSPIEAQAQVEARHAKPPRGTGRKNELYRYTPRMTDEELNEISKGSNVKVTPLFEKMLSASDAGKSGRLVLPKKCAEEFFPLINDAKGEPIVIQDSKGKDWDFIFRFWPNNNSRIYVLEGFEPYVKSMKLGEGDAVTFSRLVPEGKLVMGYRKFASASPTRQGMITATTSKMVSETKTMSNTRKPNGLISLQSDLVGAKVHVNTKRKGCEIVSTSKNIENENKMTEVIEGTRELVQSPRGSNFPSVMVEKVTGNNSNKGMVTANSNEGSDGKITPATTLSMFSKEKSTDPVNIQSDVMTANVPVGAKRKGCEIGPSSKTAENENKMSGIDLGSKEARELVQSTRDLGIKGNKDPKGMLLIGCQNDPINVQSGIIKADVPIQGKSKSCEIGSSSESTENEAKCQNAIKKHPRHRPGCLCIVCTQPGKKHPKTDLQTPPTPQAGNFLKPTEPGSSDQNDQMTVNSRLPKNRRKPWETESSSLNHQTMINSQLTNIPNPAELTSANSNYQTTVNGGSEDHQNANSFSGSDSKILPFDLNLPPETNGNFEDPMSPVQETTSGGNM